MTQKVLIALMLVIAPLVANANTSISCRVVGVSDGDTFTCLYQKNKQKSSVKVRMLNIDAPEKGQAYSMIAKGALSAAIYHKHVVLRAKEKDKYGRILALVFVGDTNVNEYMIKNGYAWAYTKYLKGQDVQYYATLQNHAQQHKLGLWRDDKPTPPWNFRKEK